MAKKKRKKKRTDDFLAGHGMTPAQQHAAEMNAAAVPVSDFEGEYEGLGTYDSPGARLLQRKAWESRMRKETGIPKLNDEEESE